MRRQRVDEHSHTRQSAPRCARSVGALFRGHPRSWGDDNVPTQFAASRSGSSPLAGRRLRGVARAVARAGLIPARGETTLVTAPNQRVLGAHPRSRGDDFSDEVAHAYDTGSSPLAGRRLGGHLEEEGNGGLIPARRETTARPSSPRSRRRAHPRSRGDDAAVVVDLPPATGSTPLAGRRPPGVRANSPGARLIPARGETTGISTVSRVRTAAHPRSRGDDTASTGNTLAQTGSSPIAGRRHSDGLPHGPVDRLIPARGETTRPAAGSRTGGAAHPRSRGDDDGPVLGAGKALGSSPLAGRRP